MKRDSGGGIADGVGALLQPEQTDQPEPAFRPAQFGLPHCQPVPVRCDDVHVPFLPHNPSDYPNPAGAGELPRRQQSAGVVAKASQVMETHRAGTMTE